MAHCTRGLLLTEPMGGVLTLIPLAAPRGVLRGGMKTDGTPECQLSGLIVRDASCRSAAPIRESLVPCVLPLSGNVTVNDSESRATFGPPFLAQGPCGTLNSFDYCSHITRASVESRFAS